MGSPHLRMKKPPTLTQSLKKLNDHDRENFLAADQEVIYLAVLRWFGPGLTADLDDLTQEALKKVWATENRWVSRNGASIITWFYSIVRNTLYEWLRERSLACRHRVQSSVSEGVAFQTGSHSPSGTSDFHSAHFLKRLENVPTGDTPEHSELIHLSEIERVLIDMGDRTALRVLEAVLEYSAREHGDLLHWVQGRAGVTLSQYSRALSRIKKACESHFGDDLWKE